MHLPRAFIAYRSLYPSVQQSLHLSVCPSVCVVGFFLSSAYLVPWAMLPDVVEASAAVDGVRRDSLFYAYFVFFQKLGTVRLCVRACVRA